MITSIWRSQRLALPFRSFANAPSHAFNIPGLKIVQAPSWAEQAKDLEKTPLTFYPLEEKYKLPKNKTYKKIAKEIQYSSQKLAECAKLIQGQPLEDAVMRLDLIKRKGAKILMEAIDELRKEIQE